MTEFEKLMAKKNASVTDSYGENIVRGGDFDAHGLKSSKKWGTMAETTDGAWTAETGSIEVQKATGHHGTPAKKFKSTVLELDALTGKRGLGATESNAEVSQTIDGISGPGTYRLSLDYKGMTKGKLSVEETGTAEIWIGDKLVSVLTQEKRGWEERIIEFTLEEGDIPADGVVDLKLVSTGKADGRGAQVDNISLREIGETGLLGDELVTNGDFENSDGRGVYDSIPGWTVNEESVIELKSVRKPITPRDKNDAYIELDSHGAESNSTVVQEIDVPEDGTYLLSFDYSPRAGRGKTPESTSPIKVMVGDEVVAEISADQVGWEPYTFNVSLAEGPVTLSFEGAGEQDTIGGLLDKVALRKVGELTEGAEPINAPEPVVAETEETPEDAGQAFYKSGLFGEVHFADEALTKLDQAMEHADETPDATFIATEIDYGNDTGWFHTPLDFVLEHDAESIEYHTEGVEDQNFNHSVIELSGQIYLEAGSHTFYNRTDDGFRLTIDGQEIAEFEGLRAAKVTKGTIEVDQDGWYDINVDYFEWKGHSKLRIEHEANGGPREVLDQDRLRHEVEPDNLGPDAIDDAATGLEDQDIVIDAVGNDTDPDGDAVFVIDATDGANGTVAFTAPVVEEVASDEVVLGENLIVNGDFEDNPLNGRIGWGHWDTIAGWESPVGRIEVQTRDYSTGNAHGNAVVELDSHGSNSNATLRQEVEVTEAGTYQFEMDYAMRGKHGWTNGVGISVNGDTIYEVVKPTEKGFQKILLDLELDAGNAVIEIYALGRQDTIGTVIDNVSLRHVTEADPVRTFTAPDGGVITYTPEPGFVGEDTFTYTISDGNGGTDTATVTVVVEADNRAPTAANDSVETNEDTAITLNLLGNDVDPDGDALTITELGDVENGTLVLNDDGTVSFTPAANFHGTVSFDYTVSDGELTSTATATIVVASVNDAVEARDDTTQTDEDVAVTFDLLRDDIDVDGDVLTISDLGPVENGSVVLNEDGTVTFTPDANFHGIATFEYTVTDGETFSTATATVVVESINDGPQGVADTAETEATTPVVIDVLANDVDADGDVLSIESVGTSRDGTVELLDDGTISFTAHQDFLGEASFSYTVTDGSETDTVEVIVLVTPPNRAPEPVDDAITMLEEGSITIDVLANDIDPDGDVLVLDSFNTPRNGTLVLNDDGTVTFTPDADFVGDVRVSYTVADDEGLIGRAFLEITVENVNDAPEPVADLAEMDRNEVLTFDVLENDFDRDADDVLELVAVASARGQVSIVNGQVVFNPDDDFDHLAVETSEDEVITYTVRDSGGIERTSTLTVTVNAPRQDSVTETLSFRETGAAGSRTDMNGEAAVLVKDAIGAEGFDNDDRLTIDLDSRGGHGRSSDRGDRGDANDSGNGGDGTDATVAGGLGGAAQSELTDAFLTGNEFDDRLSVTSEAEGGNGGRGGNGGDGGDADPLGQHTDIAFDGTERTTDYGEGTAFNGGDGGNGADGSAAGDAYAAIIGGAFDGGADDDTIDVEVVAEGGNGGNGGAGGQAGDGGNDHPFGGDHDNTSNSGNGGNGGAGGDALAELADATISGGTGDDEIAIVVEAIAGEGGDGGAGGDAGQGLYLDTTRTDNGIFLDADFEGELFSLFGDAGDGGNSGDNGSAEALVTGNLIEAGDGNDEIVLSVTAIAQDIVVGGAAGENGVDGTLTPEESGDYTRHQTAGAEGSAGADGAAGSVRIEFSGNTLDAGAGDDVFEFELTVQGQGDVELSVVDNVFAGGAGFDIIDFSGLGAGLELDLAAGALGVGEGALSNAISGFEHIIATAHADLIVGSTAGDTISGGAGDDVLSGGGGRDVFVFDNGDGADSIEDFSNDVLDLSDHSAVQEFGSLDIADTVDGALITLSGDDTILMRGIDSTELTEDNFIF